METKKENLEQNNLREERQRLKNEWRQYKRDRRCYGEGIVWGIFLIFLGVLFLLNNLGVVPWIIWNYIVSFWPVFLIMLGIKSILGNNLVSRLTTGILLTIVFGLIIIYSLYQVNSPLVNNLDPNILNIIYTFDNLRK